MTRLPPISLTKPSAATMVVMLSTCLCWPCLSRAQEGPALRSAGATIKPPDKTLPESQQVLTVITAPDVTSKFRIAPDANAPHSLLAYSKLHEKGKDPIGSISVAKNTDATVNPRAIEDDKEGPLVDLVSGNVRVTKEPKSKGQFRLKTPLVTLSVKGTDVWMSHAVGKNTSMIAVLTGFVSVESGGKSVLLREGNALTKTDDGEMQVQPIDADLYTAMADVLFAPSQTQWKIIDTHTAKAYLSGWNASSSDRVRNEWKPTTLKTDESNESLNGLQLYADKTRISRANSHDLIDISRYRYLCLWAWCQGDGMQLRGKQSVGKDVETWEIDIAKWKRKDGFKWYVIDLYNGRHVKPIVRQPFFLEDIIFFDSRALVVELKFMATLPSELKPFLVDPP